MAEQNFKVGDRVVVHNPGNKRSHISVVTRVLEDGDVRVEGRAGGDRFNQKGQITDCWGHTFQYGPTIRHATEEDVKTLQVATLRHRLTEFPWRTKSRVSDRKVREIAKLLGLGDEG